MKKQYKIPGDLNNLAKKPEQGGMVWDEGSKSRHILTQALEDQHGDSEKFKGPVDMTVYFEMMIPKPTMQPRRSEMEGDYCTSFPSLSSIVHAMGKVFKDILLDNEDAISSLTIVKRWSSDPVTSITIRELDEERKKGKCEEKAHRSSSGNPSRYEGTGK